MDLFTRGMVFGSNWLKRHKIVKRGLETAQINSDEFIIFREAEYIINNEF